MSVQIKRIYEPAGRGDGMRVLVDRLWPRGISRFDAQIALWLRDVAPSNELRHWFGHKPERWTEFRRRYRAELVGSAALKELRALVKSKKRITLLYSAHDEEHNQAVALASMLRTARKSVRPPVVKSEK